jgi:hypothetical protein
LNQIRSGLEDSGTRKIWVDDSGKREDLRRFQLVGADGCTVQIRVESVSDGFGRNRRTLATAFLYTIPLSELDLGSISAGRVGITAWPARMYVTDLNSSGGRSGNRRMAYVTLDSRDGRKVIGFKSELTPPLTKGVMPYEGFDSFVRIEFKEFEDAEPVAEAFRRAGRICGAKATAKR